MWSRFTSRLTCPICRSDLKLSVFAESKASVSEPDRALATARGILDQEFDRYIDDGILLCSKCSTYFPIFHGLPILIPYTTPGDREFASQFGPQLAAHTGYKFANAAPVSGEQFVMSSFSTEWLDYDSDGVIWDLSYEDHEKRLPSLVRSGRRLCGLV